MNELPKSVREELARQQQAPASHPDADLLTAYAEGTATAGERAKIELHIASCGDCREAMFLATPASEPTAPLIAAPAKPRLRWFRSWMPLAATAAILIVATFTFVGKNNGLRQDAKLSVPAPPPPAAKEPSVANSTQGEDAKILPPQQKLDSSATRDADTLAYALPKKEAAIAGRRDEATSKDELKKSNDKVAAGGIVAGDLVRSEPAPVPPVTADGYSARRSTNQALKPGPAAPLQNQMANAQNQYSLNQNVQSQNSQKQALQDQPASSSETVEVAAGAAPVQAARAKAAPAAGTLALSKLAESPSQWRISVIGNVERLQSGSWNVALAQSGAKFAVVATIGPVVWAGGTHGALFRSVDLGNTWQKIEVPGLNTNDTIAKIEFKDAFNGTISTADRRSWTTHDRGETWQQLP